VTYTQSTASVLQPAKRLQIRSLVQALGERSDESRQGDRRWCSRVHGRAGDRVCTAGQAKAPQQGHHVMQHFTRVAAAAGGGVGVGQHLVVSRCAGF
jgi:hypothetical protein